MIAKLFVMVCVVSFSLGALHRKELSANPEFPDSCVFEQGEPPLLIVLKAGESRSAPIGICSQYDCGKSETGFSLSEATCGSIGAPTGCHLSPINTAKEYPGCCPEIVC